MQGFRDAIEGCGLKDLGYSGYKFTWSNKYGDNFIEERLDRALATDEWLDLYPSFVVNSIIWDYSDHSPIIVRAHNNLGFAVHDFLGDAKPFRFEAKWLHVKDFRAVVDSAWSSADRSTLGSWTDKIKSCGRILDKWGKNTFKHMHSRLRWLLKRLKYLRGLTQSAAFIKEERRAEEEIRSIRKKIETEAWQHCRPFILRDGDKNTSYFHYRASHRHKRNKIESLLDVNGRVCVSPEDLTKVVLSYYTDLFSSSRPPLYDGSFANIDRRLTNDMQAMLVRKFEKEEVIAALKSMHPGKSPGHDGFPAMFYTKFWDIVG